MHILVTGGTGFIGKPLCAALLAGGHRVTVLTRHPAKAQQAQPGIEAVDSLDAVAEADAVVNLAGEPLAQGRWNAQRKAAFRASRLGTTEKLLSWVGQLARPPTVMVSGSAIGYYGAHGDEAVDEETARGEDFAAKLCGDWEIVADAARSLGVRVCRIRIGIVLGADGGALAQMLPPFRFGLGGPMGSGQQWMSWVARDDLIALILWLIATPSAQGAYNATAPAPVRNAEFARTLGKVLHRPAVLPMPAFVLRAMFGEMAGLLLAGQRVLPVRATAEGFVFRHTRLAEALTSVLQAP